MPESDATDRSTPVSPIPSATDAEKREYAEYIVRTFKRSGYGTPHPHRYSPSYDPATVAIVADAYLALLEDS